ncbi:MAG: ATP-binding protein [Oscillospiraceae bacterium]|nr:ATP-binding protein [Oscillospiraceae bacterium]
MALDEKYYEAAHSVLAARRAENERIQLMRRAEVIAKAPEYAQLETKLADKASGVVQLIMRKDKDFSAQLEALKNEALSLNRAMESLLTSLGLDKDYLEPQYTCKLCKDKGCVDGKWCGCFMKQVYAAASKALNDRSPMKLKSFDDFDLSLYPDSSDKPSGGENPRKIMAQNLSRCIEYANSFDGTGSGMLMIGATGLGKTHLSLAVANAVIERGYSAIYGSVPELLRMMDNEQFRRAEGDTMSLLLGCELLILDDLGAETKSEYNIARLYEIINARVNRGIPMIISTNLNPQQINERYQDRIWSRLFSMEVLMFSGTDNRIKLSNR